MKGSTSRNKPSETRRESRRDASAPAEEEEGRREDGEGDKNDVKAKQGDGDGTRDATGESATEAEAEAVASERASAASLLGWVRLNLAPPPAGVGSSQEASPPLLGAREYRAEGGRTVEGARSGFLPASPGHVWFHVPSARLLEELPASWVAFAGVSGGILADVSRSGCYGWVGMARV